MGSRARHGPNPLELRDITVGKVKPSRAGF